MNLLFGSKKEEEKFVSSYSNPFKSDKCEEIIFHVRNNFWSSYKMSYSATIHFKHGDTTGTHQIKSDDFTSLVQKVQAFIQTL